MTFPTPPFWSLPDQLHSEGSHLEPASAGPLSAKLTTSSQAGARYGSTRGDLGREESRTLDQQEQKTIQAVELRKILGVLKSSSQQVFDVSDLLTQ